MGSRAWGVPGAINTVSIEETLRRGQLEAAEFETGTKL